MLRGKKIVIFGFGTQGQAHALNLKESGLDVTVVLRPNSRGVSEARSQGLPVLTDPKEAAGIADLAMILIPDESQKTLWEEHLKDHLREGAVLAFAHGFNIHYKRITPRADLDVILISPKAVGQKVRSLYQEGHGPICLMAVSQDKSGKAREIALAYAKGIGGTRAGVIETTFAEETETNLFGEQAVLCGGLTHLMQAGFETLVAAGYQPEVAYFETVHEVKLLADLIYQNGFRFTREAISNTAEYGDYTRGPCVINESSREAMSRILKEIQSGEFAKEYLGEVEKGTPNLKRYRKLNQESFIEKVGEKVHALMTWL